MTDERVRYLNDELGLRATAAVTTDLVSEATARHRCTPTTTAALGRTLTAAALLGSALKGEGSSLTLRITGGGPAGTIICTCSARGDVRGYLQHPEVDVPPTPQGKLDVAGVVGSDGYLSVAYDLGLREPYSGSAPMVDGEIARDLSYYLTISEQMPSAVGLGVLVGSGGAVMASGGFLVQHLPAVGDDTRERISQAIADIARRCEELESVSHLIVEGAGAHDLITRVAGDTFMRLTASEELRLCCECSRQKAADLLVATEDGRFLTDGEGVRKIKCEFCGQTYAFDPGELADLAENTDEQ